jgi:hypothetical protein
MQKCVSTCKIYTVTHFLFYVMKTSRFCLVVRSKYIYICSHMVYNLCILDIFFSLHMELFSFLPMSLDINTSIIILIFTLIGIYWFWFKPRSSVPIKSEDVIKTIRNLQTSVSIYFRFVLNKLFFL